MNDEDSGDAQVDAGAVCRYRGRCAGPCQRLATDVADPAELADLDCIRSFRQRDVIVYLALTAVVTVLCFVGAYRYFFTKGMGALDATAGRALSLYSQRLEREIDKFGMLPLAMSMNRDVIDYLGGDRSPARGQALTRTLRALNDGTGALQTYVIDSTNHVIASSNGGEPGTFIGRDLSYRPYVQQAKAGRVEGYYAVGTTGNTAGYYLATAVENNGRRLGIVATKIGLDRLEHYWLGSIERRVVVLDENGVVVLSSRPEWKGRVTRALTDAQRQHLYDTQQYNRAPLATLVWQSIAPAFGEKRFVRVGLGDSTQDYLAVSTVAPGLAMQLVVLVDPTDARRLAFAEAGLVAILVALVALAAHIVYEKRLTAQEQRLSREALHVAYERLKEQFERRSEQLRIANEWLRREVAERVESEGKAAQLSGRVDPHREPCRDRPDVRGARARDQPAARGHGDAVGKRRALPATRRPRHRRVQPWPHRRAGHAHEYPDRALAFVCAPLRWRDRRRAARGVDRQRARAAAAPLEKGGGCAARRCAVTAAASILRDRAA